MVQFKIATEASRPDPKEFENVFGKKATWEWLKRWEKSA